MERFSSFFLTTLLIVITNGNVSHALCSSVLAEARVDWRSHIRAEWLDFLPTQSAEALQIANRVIEGKLDFTDRLTFIEIAAGLERGSLEPFADEIADIHGIGSFPATAGELKVKTLSMRKILHGLLDSGQIRAAVSQMIRLGLLGFRQRRVGETVRAYEAARYRDRRQRSEARAMLRRDPAWRELLDRPTPTAPRRETKKSDPGAAQRRIQRRIPAELLKEGRTPTRYDLIWKVRSGGQTVHTSVSVGRLQEVAKAEERVLKDGSVNGLPIVDTTFEQLIPYY